ncbi:MAG: response regulator [Deltaproteobacteria bacterium]|nr:response regulator [Deltaproteobacteria bacterium]
MKILIVDDNQGLAHILKMMLDEEKHEVRLARDGKDGYLNYLLCKPDLIITDIQMPEKNGLKLMEIIRKDNPEIKTIYVSADLSRFLPLLEEEKRRYPVSYLQKPFSKSELMRLLSLFSSERREVRKVKEIIPNSQIGESMNGGKRR